MYTTGIPRIILGSLLVLIIPGYTLLSALIPRKDKMNSFERVIFSFGLSFATTAFIGIALSFTPWGIQITSIIITLAAFILITAAIGWYRQKLIPEVERYYFTISSGSFRKAGTRKKSIWLYILTALVIAFSGWVIYTVSNSIQDEKYTEFYILDSSGQAQNYPQQLDMGDSIDIIVGIINHEDEAMNYQVKVTIDNEAATEITTGPIDHFEKWERDIHLNPALCGNNQKVEIWLYRSGETQPYQEKPLYFYIDVLCP
jgi:uncharacterized membrane protein